MSNYLGDFPVSGTVRGKFNTSGLTSGAPITLAGTPSIRVYKDDSTTETTTGITLTVDFDSVTGAQHWVVDLSSDLTFYATGHEFFVQIAAGTVDSVSVVGTVLGRFSIGRNPSVNTVQVGGTTQTAGDLAARLPAALTSGGFIKSDALAINGVSTSSVTTINANQGTTQPVNFQGTGSTAFVKSDARTWLGSPLPLPNVAGYPLVDFEKIRGFTPTDTSGQVAAAFSTFFNIASPTSTMNLITGTTNAPTTGDLTALMKASVTSAVPTANQNADALLDRIDAVETGWTLRKIFRLVGASLAGKLSIIGNTVTIRDVTDTKDRITATTDINGQRTAITLDGA